MEQILHHEDTRRGPKFTVRFSGYGPEEDAKLWPEDLGNCWDLVVAYCHEHGVELPRVGPQD